MITFIKLVYFNINRLFISREKYLRMLGINIGEKCNIGRCSWGSEPYLIQIGNHVQITKGVKFITHGGGWVLRERKPNFDIFGRIVIGNNVIILPGVTIDDNVIVGAESVVTKSIPSNSIVAGNPAKIVSNINSYELNMEKYNVNSKSLNAKDKIFFLQGIFEEKLIKKGYLK